MKIKLMGLSESALDCDFKLNNIHDVLKVGVSGDTSAYDIFYLIDSNTNHKIWVQDITIEEIETDKNVKKFINSIDKFITQQYKDNGLQFEFKFELELK